MKPVNLYLILKNHYGLVMANVANNHKIFIY